MIRNLEFVVATLTISFLSGCATSDGPSGSGMEGNNLNMAYSLSDASRSVPS